MASRMSMYSMASEALGGGPQAAQVSTTTLLNAIHNIYLSSQPYQLDASTSLVVNTWLTAAQAGATVDATLAARAWEHARRRAEDGCVILGSLHQSTPSLLVPFLNTFPFAIPASIYKSLEALQPFLRCVTPYNASAPRQIALGVTLTLSLGGNVTGASLALSQGGIDTENGLLNIPAEAGYRAFDVFYYLLTSASTPAEREFLGLKSPSAYALLARSGTYEPPSYLITADDGAAADDFRQALKEIGIKGSAHRNFISTLAGLLKLGNTLDYDADSDDFEEICEDVSGLLGMEPEVLMQQLSTEDRRTLVGGLYEALVDWVISKANSAIAAQMLRIRDGDESIDGRGVRTPTSNEDGDTVSITVVEVPEPSIGRALAMRTIFDDTIGINAEMIEDGVEVHPVGSSVVREMQQAVSDVAPDLGIMTGPQGRDRQHDLEKREVILEKVAYGSEDDSFVKKLLFPVEGEGVSLGRAGRFDLPALLSASRTWFHLSLHPTDDSPANLATLPAITSAWSAGTVSRQLRSWRLPEWANRRNRNLDYTADFDVDEFVGRYGALGCKDGKDGIETWMLERGWSNGEVFIGKERIWVREGPWWEAETMLDIKPAHSLQSMGQNPFTSGFDTSYSANPPNGSGFFPPPAMDNSLNGSNDQLMHTRNFSQGNMSQVTLNQHQNLNPQSAPSIAPSAMRNVQTTGDYGLGTKGDTYKGQVYYNEDGEFTGILDGELAKNKKIESKPLPFGRRAWIAFVWALTFWIPSPLLKFIGRMRRPDVRMAWREKFVLFFLIILINGMVVFWIIGFGKLLCPNANKAWNVKEVATHAEDEKSFWVAIHGKVYDITDFWQQQHSDTSIKVTKQNMLPLSGMVMDNYFMPPLNRACRGLGIKETTQLTFNDTITNPLAQHTSGFYTRDRTSALHDPDWYWKKFQPKIKEYYHGNLVWKKSKVKNEGENEQHMWATYGNEVYDLTDYLHTLDVNDNFDSYKFLNEDMVDLWKNSPGTNIKKDLDLLIANAKNETVSANLKNSWQCIQNIAYKGILDFRDSARCQVNNYLLLAFAIIICIVTAVKFLAALQFGSKRRPSPQDKFVICQVPVYTEGEDSLRKALDSLTALQYDNKRKLICVICDGVVVGQGNDRPTPKIVLDILGVDPKVDPPALPFKSVGSSSEQLNYGKVYSGLYEFEGNVVPYIVVVKVGKESEQSKAKPGNRGKRDSQILLMSFLNRVHHRAPMSPLELEMFHQVNNIIGVDPELYEYLLMVDADTCVEEDSLNRLVAACAHNAKIAGICGETALENDEKTWWTMIQVYEYFISHHLAKAFESLFGSVTCLPGCFTMYRLRSVDKGKPLIISDAVIKDYSVCDVDTLHKKNLLSLGEDRYLTTLMTKYFPEMSYKFIPDAQCKTAAPESWSVLLSQRRRWINSTIHNLVELMQLKELCGFCCFSMRFVVFIDLCGTIILPSTCVYIGYLIYILATGSGPIPYISLAMIGAVYGLQALIFILKRQWQHIGWMIIYILAFPIYSFILPLYSFWNQDNFSWGNTRIVIGEKGNKQVVAVDDEGFDPRSIPLQRWDDYALANNLPGRRGGYQEKTDYSYGDNYELDEIKSVYSAGPQGSVLTGMPGRNTYMPPQSPAFNNGRASTMGFQDSPMQHRQSMMSMGTGVHDMRSQSPYQDYPGQHPSVSNLRGQANLSPATGGGHSRSGTALGFSSGARSPMPDAMRSQSSFDFQHGHAGPNDMAIVESIRSVLCEVDLDTVTKKQVRALVEQRLQTELVGERRTFMDRQIDHELENM
ncbi:chitin synthase [Fusarium oxysporum f. sp. lycopersici 4287]|uniref:Chitin synthase Vb n=4 Tax=Fusarium oxysporum TaxID=5507 RepID=CHS5B_FUSO4|nr:chitin synthase [Fusarium oxysporum f. sp. lycopersici 4287]ABS11265.1 ChsVb [Fusarium oxysporum f. sp. lycopersici]EXK44265.1 chitin synthase [Fusarium oxysporum f. sp. melonis 26406]KNB00666.1 chitin synthase [Fusarium oxysporum f. sp. lycopersici 4287]